MAARTAMMISIEVCFLAIFIRLSTIRTRGLAIIAITQPMTKGIKNLRNLIPRTMNNITPKTLNNAARIPLTYFFHFFISKYLPCLPVLTAVTAI